MTSNNAFAARTCIVGVVITNESNMASYFSEAGNLNCSNANMCSDVAEPSSSGAGDFFDFGSSSSSRTFTIYTTASTTGCHLGFERDYNSHTAFRDVLRHYAWGLLQAYGRCYTSGMIWFNCTFATIWYFRIPFWCMVISVNEYKTKENIVPYCTNGKFDPQQKHEKEAVIFVKKIIIALTLAVFLTCALVK